MKAFEYIGVLKPEIGANRFATSIFRNEVEDTLYCQEAEGGIITGFCPLDTDREILHTDQKIVVSSGHDYVFSYVTEDDALFAGSRQTMEPYLLKCADRITNPFSRLYIMSFLRLYYKTVFTIKDCNKELVEMGIVKLLEEDSVFDKHTVGHDNIQLVSMIQRRFFSMSKQNERIDLEDVAIFRNNQVYFNGHTYPIELLLKKSFLGSNEESIVARLLNKSQELYPIDLESLIRTNAFEFLLTSEEIFLDQHQIESLLYKNPSNYRDGSSIEVSLKVDKELGTIPLSTSERVSYENEKSLTESYYVITGEFVQ